MFELIENAELCGCKDQRILIFQGILVSLNTLIYRQIPLSIGTLNSLENRLRFAPHESSNLSPSATKASNCNSFWLSSISFLLPYFFIFVAQIMIVALLLLPCKNIVCTILLFNEYSDAQLLPQSLKEI